MAYELKLFSGNANRPLAEEIAQHLRLQLGDAEVSRFSDGEVYVQINENVRGEDVFIVQPTCPPVNDTLMELLVMIDAFKRASARRITAVLPYYGYARQDRKVQPRVPISAKLVADLITAAGATRVLAIDLHAGPDPGLLQHPGRPPLRRAGHHRLPGEEGSARSRAGLARRGRRRAGPRHRQAAQGRAGHHRQAPRRPERGRLHAPDRRRRRQGRGRHRRHDRHGRHPDPGRGRPQARGGAPHPGLRRPSRALGPAIARIKESPDLEELVVTNSIPLPPEKLLPKITVLSVAPLLAEAIRRIHDEESVSTLFV